MAKSMEQVLEALLAEVREAKNWTALPTVLSKKRAARELGISLSKLKTLIRTGDLATCIVGRTAMVPASEVQRIAAVRKKPVAPARSGRARSKKASTRPTPSEAEKIRAALKRR